MWTNSMVDSSDRKKAISGLNNAYNLLIRNTNSTENLSNTPSIEHEERQAIFELSNPINKVGAGAVVEPSGGDASGGEEAECGSRNFHQLISPRSATRMRVLDRLVRGTTIFGLNEEKPSNKVLAQTGPPPCYLDIGQHELQKRLTTSPNISEATRKQQKQKQIETEIHCAIVEEIKPPPKVPVPVAKAVKNDDKNKNLLQLSQCSSLQDFDLLEDETLKKIDYQFIRDHCSADVCDITQLYANDSQSSEFLDAVSSDFEFPPQRPRIVPLPLPPPPPSQSQATTGGHVNYNDYSNSSSSTTLNEDTSNMDENHFQDFQDCDNRGLLRGGCSSDNDDNTGENWNNHENKSASSSEEEEDLSSENYNDFQRGSQTSIDSTAPPAKKMKTRTSPHDEINENESEFDLKNSSISSLKSNYSAELLLPPCPIVTSSITFNPEVEDEKLLPVRGRTGQQNGPILHLNEALAQSLSLQSLQQIIPDPEDFFDDDDSMSMDEFYDDEDDIGILGTTAEWDYQARLRREEKEKQILRWNQMKYYFALAFSLPILLLILYQFLARFWSTN